MPSYPISPAGQFGVLADVATHETPLNSWSMGNNVHFLEDSAQKVSGYKSLYGGASIIPYFVTTLRPPVGAPFWIYAGATAVYAFDTSHHDITRASGPYTSSNWQGGIMNGIMYLNNGKDKPQMWNPAVNTQLLIDLPNWPATARAAVVRSFKNYMIALDVTKSSTRDPRLVKWSHPSAAGSYPSSWDETDPTKDAGEYSLAETEGQNVDCLPLRDTNIIYKDDSIWGMTFVGGIDIFRFFNIFRNVGIMARNCAVEFQTGHHLVFARDDIFVHDGQTITPIIRQKTRSLIYNAIDANNAKNSLVAIDAPNTEIWICYPETGNTYCNRALIWNWRSNAIGFRDLPLVSSIGIGVVDITAGTDSWSSDSSTWDSDPSSWGQTIANPSQTRLVMAVPGESKLQGVLPNISSFDGVNFTSELEKTGIGIPFKENVPPDISSMKFCSRIWPKITGTIGGIVQVRFGSQMDLSDAPVYGAWQNYVIGTTKKIDVTTSGRLFAINFKSTTSISWKLQGYSLDVEFAGGF